jgi:hypothetical protein
MNILDRRNLFERVGVKAPLGLQGTFHLLRSISMVRFLAVACALAGFLFLLQGPVEGVQQKAQMVKGTIKEVQLDKDVLIVNQKVKNEVVDRELSILSTTEFVVTNKGVKSEGVGSAGLKLLENAKGATVQVKCDKDVQVLKVTVTIK